VLFRSAEALERLRDVDTIVLDKTGTLTVGRPEVVSVIPVDASRRPSCCVLREPRAGQRASRGWRGRHCGEGTGLKLGRSYGFRAMPGKGALGVVQLRNVAVGNAALMAEAGVDAQSLEPEHGGCGRSGRQ